MRQKYKKRFRRAPVLGGPHRLRQLRQFDFGFQYEEDDKLRIIVPLPGVDKDKLKVEAKEQLLTITSTVRDDLQKYAARPDDQWDILLKTSVIPTTAKARYVDGILLVDIDIQQGEEVKDIQYE